MLNDESLTTLFAETETILYSRSLTVKILDDVKSEQHICPYKILAMETKIVMPLPAELVRADVFSRKRWRRIHQAGC